MPKTLLHDPRLRMPRWILSGAIAGLCFCLWAPSLSLAADDSADELIRRAKSECDQGRLATERETRKEHFERGQALGERAVTLADGNADAHFAVFCNMGELMRLDGETIRSVFALRR